jgi:hypothetical protein
MRCYGDQKLSPSSILPHPEELCQPESAFRTVPATLTHVKIKIMYIMRKSESRMEPSPNPCIYYNARYGTYLGRCAYWIGGTPRDVRGGRDVFRPISTRLYRGFFGVYPWNSRQHPSEPCFDRALPAVTGDTGRASPHPATSKTLKTPYPFIDLRAQSVPLT